MMKGVFHAVGNIAKQRAAPHAAAIWRGQAQDQKRCKAEACTRHMGDEDADHARSLHIFQPAIAVGDAPVTRHQLHALRAMIADRDRIRPKPAPGLGPRLVSEILRLNRDFDLVCDFRVHGACGLSEWRVGNRQ